MAVHPRGNRLLLLCLVGLLAWPAGVWSDSITSGQSLPDEIRPSTLILDIAMPLDSLYAAWDRIDAELPVVHQGPEGWISLGGGTGYLNYRLTGGTTAFRATRHHIDIVKSSEVSADYARKTNGAVVKLTACGAGPLNDRPSRLEIRARTDLSFTQEYSLGLHTTILAVQPREPCKLRNLDIDAAPLIAQIARSALSHHLRTVDRQVARSFEFREKAEAVWRQLQDPIPLDDGGQTWLRLNPGQISADELSVADGTLTTTLRILIAPQIVTGHSPDVPYLPLPPLQRRTHASGFHLAFDIPLSYREASALLMDQLAGRTYGIGPEMVSVDTARIYPNGDEAAMDIGLTGIASITLVLTGRPQYEERTGMLVFRHLDYQVKQRSLMTDAVEWFLHDEFRRQLEASLTIPLHERIDALRRQLETGLNRKLLGGALHGTVERLRLLRLVTEPKTIVASFQAEGQLHLLTSMK